MNRKIGRNDPCPCGSGKKYKNCCMGKQETHKTFTPGGKRKFKAKVIDVTDKSQDVFQRVATGELKPGDLEALKFRMTDHDYRAKGKEEKHPPETKREEGREPQPGEVQEREESFKPTTEDYREEKE